VLKSKPCYDHVGFCSDLDPIISQLGWNRFNRSDDACSDASSDHIWTPHPSRLLRRNFVSSL